MYILESIILTLILIYFVGVTIGLISVSHQMVKHFTTDNFPTPLDILKTFAWPVIVGRKLWK